jgi:dienelactone hydrolase
MMLKKIVAIIIVTLAVFGVLVVSNSFAGDTHVARMEILSFRSTTLTDQEFLIGLKEGKPVTISGELRLPRPGNDRLPAVILVHGAVGIVGYVTDWEQDLNDMGVATFVFDSFTPRGIDTIINDQSQLSRLAMIVDAYRALELLAKHPRIDPQRIAIMGFSLGGQVTLYASLKRFQKMHGPAGLEFAAYFPLYANCTTAFRDEENVANKPIRLFHGTADDSAPIEPCRDYVERLKAKGKDVLLTEYAGAAHVFDWQALKKPIKREKAQTTRNCHLTEAQDGVIINAKTMKPFTYSDPCVEYGTTLAYDEKASANTRKLIREFVITMLKP